MMEAQTMVKKVAIINTGGFSSQIAKAIMKADNSHVVVGVDLAKGDDVGVEVKFKKNGDKFIMTDFKTIERQPDVPSDEVKP